MSNVKTHLLRSQELAACWSDTTCRGAACLESFLKIRISQSQTFKKTKRFHIQILKVFAELEDLLLG